MQILRLQPVGVDTVTFWRSEIQPEGCFIHFDGGSHVFTPVAVQPGRGKPHKVGLLPIHIPLYKHIAQVNSMKPLGDFDYDLVSSYTEIYVIVRKGGMGQLDAGVTAELEQLRLQVDQPNLAARIQAAVNGRGQ